MGLKLKSSLIFFLLCVSVVNCSGVNFHLDPHRAQNQLTPSEISIYQLSKGVQIKGKIRYRGKESFNGAFLLEAEGDRLKIRIIHSLGPTITELYLSPRLKQQWLPQDEILYQYPSKSTKLNTIPLPLDAALIRFLIMGGSKINPSTTLQSRNDEAIQAVYKGEIYSMGIPWPQKVWLTVQGAEATQAEGSKKELFFYIQSIKWGHFDKIELSPASKKSRLLQVSNFN